VNVSELNPELVRNARIQLRRGRMLAAAVICVAVSLSCAAYYLDKSPSGSFSAIEDGRNLFQLVLGLQIVALLIGGGLYCLQSVHREKDLNTFDYQRITRMTPLELTTGKLLGAPVMTYFIFLCLMPIACWAAILGQIPVSALLGIYVVAILGSVTYHALAVLISLLLERGASAGGVLFFLFMVGISSIDFSQGESVFAIHSISPFYAFKLVPSRIADAALRYQPWVDLGLKPDSFFGLQVPHFWVLVALYATLTAWFLLACARNIKRDPTAYEVYSPGQGFAFVLYLNILLLGFFRWVIPHIEYMQSADGRPSPAVQYRPIYPSIAEEVFLGISLWFFVILGLVLLRNRDRVRRRIREFGAAAAGWGAALWPAPYLLAGAVLAGLGIVDMIRLRLDRRADWNPGVGLLEAGFFAMWIVRDLLYLQWMNLRRARRPLVTGILYLVVFYICARTFFYPLKWYGPSGAPYAAIFVPFQAFGLNAALFLSATNAWIFALILLPCEALFFVFLQRRELQKLLAASSQP